MGTLPRLILLFPGANSTRPYVLVNEEKNWADAQRYCRSYHTDLASVRNQAENGRMDKARRSYDVWIGLFRDAWVWSDGSSSSFRNWGSGEPGYDSYAMVDSSGLWFGVDSMIEKPFICYEVPNPAKRRILRVELQTNSDTEDPALQAAILQQIQQRLREKGMPATAKLTWRSQPDGKIFQKKEKEREEGRKRKEL